jgi:hypothetical protein
MEDVTADKPHGVQAEVCQVVLTGIAVIEMFDGGAVATPREEGTFAFRCYGCALAHQTYAVSSRGKGDPGDERQRHILE